MKKISSAIVVMLLTIVGISAAQAEPVKMEIVLHASTTLKRAQEALERGRIDEAVRYFERALRRGVSSRERLSLHNNLCIAYFYREQFDLAKKQCDRAISVSPGSWRAYNNRGNIHVETGAYAKAIGDYEMALSLSSEPRLVEGNLDLALRREEEAGDINRIRDKSEPKEKETPQKVE